METVEKLSPSTLVFRGGYILGNAAVIDSKQAAEIATFILLGHYDRELSYFLNWRKTGQYGTSEVEVIKNAAEELERVKGYIRFQINGIIRDAEHADQVNRERAFKSMIADMKDSSKPHPLGTVAQLATRFNISKSEVRRMRTAGTLDQFIMEKTNGQASEG